MKRLFCMAGMILAVTVGGEARSQTASAPNCDPYAIEVTTRPVPPQVASSLKAMYDKQVRAIADPDVLLLGDSLLDGWGKQVEADFPGKKVWNLGVGGNRVQNTVWVYQSIDRTRIKPKNVVLLVGTNNLSVSPPINCAISAGVVDLAEAILNDWPAANLFLVEVPPRGADFKTYDKDRKELNAALRSFAEKQARVAFVTLDEIGFTCGNYPRPALDPIQVLVDPSLAYVCGNYVKDNLHFAPDGYRALREALRAASLTKFGSDTLE